MCFMLRSIFIDFQANFKPIYIKSNQLKNQEPSFILVERNDYLIK